MLDRAAFSLNESERDYATVREALRFITERAAAQPGVEEMAGAVGLDAAELTALLRRWCGLTPKGFLQAVTLDHARRGLDAGLSVLDCALEVGLSGPSRLHDLFVAHEALSPGEYKSGGIGLEITWGIAPSPFGTALLMRTPRGLCGLAFVQEEQGDGAQALAFADMARRWPNAAYVRDDAALEPLARRVFDPARWRAQEPLEIILIGTDFEVRVWQGLLKVPFAATTSYSALARAIDKPQAARAVGAAVGRNPLSFVVPCHRVVGKSGALTGYHWGLTRKRAMLGWEAGHGGA